jgi:phosphate transport system permease protein
MLDRLLRLSGWFVAISLFSVLVSVFWTGVPRLSLDFITQYPSRIAENAGLRSAILGTTWVMALTTLFSIPVGVSAAVFLSEYAPQQQKFFRFIRLNIANLAGVPSIIYGILGLALFVRGLDLGRSILAGALTLTTMALPTIILSSLEALESVPKHLRMSARALGATRWQTVRDHVLPAALPGLCTGILLALSRVAGETAPLIMMGAMTYVAFDPTGVKDSFTVIPIQIYNWASRPQPAFQVTAAAGIVVLLVILFSINLIALFIKYKYSSEKFNAS